jgi:primase-polymerase (primpol)-like protein
LSTTGKKATDPGPRPVFTFRKGWYHNIPDELLERTQWVDWRYDIRAGKYTKVLFQSRKPFNEEKGLPTYKAAKTNDPPTWGEFSQAVNFQYGSKGFLDGVGYVLAADDPFTGWDLDNCLNEDGTLRDWAKLYFAALAYCYFDISPSGGR